MILKASQRGGGQDLAAHLMRADENEHVLVHELSGFISDDLKGAFKEADAISRGTKCRQYLFSLSLSPPEDASVAPDVFERAIDRIGERLGLDGQPRAIVFHEKEGRRHAHCVWSRIDAETMTACHLPFFKQKLIEVSRDLYLEHGWKMPRGFENAAERDPTNFNLAEWQQAKRQGIDPRWLKQTLQACWSGSDNAQAFMRSLEERGFIRPEECGPSVEERCAYILEREALYVARRNREGRLFAIYRAMGIRLEEDPWWDEWAVDPWEEKFPRHDGFCHDDD
ncbi:relaxase/mobilization nuclease domain-containing protein [Phenylobacterium sp.]|jgi:hypothetical protein|uniref:relaxase/mobilization nuclease domain-containing protein n=1 Tax=Phenylobacterium sp. TaxID=1871053 RepID=UPI002F3FA94A